MNKIYLIILSVITLTNKAQVASCSLDPIFIASNKTGIWPDSATNFISGTEGQAYIQNLTIKVPKDTVTGFGTFCFTRIEVSSPTGITNFNLPPGVSMLAGNNVTLSGSTFKFPGNANTCALLSGTPTVAGTYTCQFKVQPYVTTSGGSCPASPNVNSGSAITAPQTLTYYKIIIAPVAGIKEEVNAKTLNLNNIPNPFSNKTAIKFNVKDEAPVKICVYNLLGSKMFEDKFKSVKGDNVYELDATEWSSGIYLYTVQYKNHTETKRMVLNSTR